MWFQLANVLSAPDDVFLLHPRAAGTYLEHVWHRGSSNWNAGAVSPLRPAAAVALPPVAGAAPAGWPLVGWHHLIYAYFIENTRAYEILGRVIRKFTQGEELESPNPLAHNWLRQAEMLLFRHASGDSIYAVESELRPSGAAVRRNAYYRMFGMELNHGTADNQPVAFEKSAVANRSFVALFEELLRQLWLGYINAVNTSGPNTTDDNGIARIAEQISAMLNARRRDWMLAREEYFAVAMMNYVHYTLSYDSPIVLALRGGMGAAGFAHERLARIGERVGLPPHSRSREYFDLAEAASRMLIAIEGGIYNNAVAVPALYLPGSAALQDTLDLIDLWSTATGRQLRTPVMSTLVAPSLAISAPTR